MGSSRKSFWAASLLRLCCVKERRTGRPCWRNCDERKPATRSVWINRLSKPLEKLKEHSGGAEEDPSLVHVKDRQNGTAKGCQRCACSSPWLRAARTKTRDGTKQRSTPAQWGTASAPSDRPNRCESSRSKQKHEPSIQTIL